MEVDSSITIWLSITESNRENAIIPLILYADHIKLLEHKGKWHCSDIQKNRFIFCTFLTKNLHRHEVGQNESSYLQSATFDFALNYKISWREKIYFKFYILIDASVLSSRWQRSQSGSDQSINRIVFYIITVCLNASKIPAVWNLTIDPVRKDYL